MRAAALAAVLLVLAAAGHAGGVRDWNALNTLQPGAEIRVELAGGKTLRGFLQSWTADSVVVNGATSQERLARSDVKRVQFKRESRRGRNTLIGLGIGAGGGIAAGAALDAKTPDGFLFQHFGKAVIAPVGAIIGTVVGVAWPTGGWRDLYRAP